MRLLLTSCADKVIGRAVPLLPKAPRDCKIICIPTAANAEDGDRQWLAVELDNMRRAGLDLALFALEGKSEADLAAVIQDADIVYLTGGNTFYLLEQMRACHFEKHIRNFLDRGGLYIGSSASTIVTGPDIDFARAVDDPAKAPTLTDTRGLSLVDFYIMVHMDHPAFARKAARAAADLKQRGLHVYCLNDDQALFVDGKSVTTI